MIGFFSSFGSNRRRLGFKRLTIGLAVGSLAVNLILCGLSPFKVQPAWSKPKEKNTSGSAQENFDIGMKRFKEGDIDGAIDSYLQAIYFARNGYNPWAYFWLGECYKLKKENAKGIEAFKQHIEQVMGPTPDGHIELGYLYMETGHDDEARNEFYTALGQFMGPGPRAHNALGKLWEKEGKYREALGCYRDALGTGPWTYLEAWMNYAECFIKLKDWGSGYAQLQTILNSETIKLTKDDQQKIFNDMGLCLLAKGDHEGAMRRWRECLSINPSNAVAHLNLAMLFDSESHISSAIAEYKQFVRLAPRDEKVGNVKDRLEALEQKLHPQEPVSSAKPTPYMRQQAQEAEAAKRKAFEELSAPPPPTENPF
jgi:tetratricopeptide (TPR) repeat protein